MTKRKCAVVLDTDVGTDDAVAFLIADYLPDVNFDFIIATQGNTSLHGATVNAIILKKHLNMQSKIVQGKSADFDRNVNEKEKNTFHGNDGLGNIRNKMIDELCLSDDELSDYMSYEEYCEEILQYDEIKYIAIGPTTNLAGLLKNNEFKNKISEIYIMGGGLNEFNCSNNTEFNFSKNPRSVEAILKSGLSITLFTLDLTNHQRINEEQIKSLEKFGNHSDFITMLRFNKKSNIEFNNIDSAVIHDAMPVLYAEYPEKFKTETVRLTVDKYGATKLSDSGYPVNIATAVENDLLYNILMDIFSKGKAE